MISAWVARETIWAVVPPHTTLAPSMSRNCRTVAASRLGSLGGPVSIFTVLPQRQVAMATVQSSPAVFAAEQAGLTNNLRRDLFAGNAVAQAIGDVVAGSLDSPSIGKSRAEASLRDSVADDDEALVGFQMAVGLAHDGVFEGHGALGKDGGMAGADENGLGHFIGQDGRDAVIKDSGDGEDGVGEVGAAGAVHCFGEA